MLSNEYVSTYNKSNKIYKNVKFAGIFFYCADKENDERFTNWTKKKNLHTHTLKALR